MDLGLSGRVALVTGSTKGLGKAIAKTLASEGANIIVNGRNRYTVIRTIPEFKGYGIQTYSGVCDVTDPTAVKNFFEQVVPAIGRLDILVNNAGNIEKTGNMFELTENDWLRAFDLSFMSMVRLSLAAHPWLKKSGHGRIINISSLAAIQPSPNAEYAHYAAAKAAMLPVSKMMANDFAKDNILVNTICPATLHGGGWEQNRARRVEKMGLSLEQTEKIMLETAAAKSPLGRIGKLEDVANLVAFLASDKANYITGQVFCVDGGIKRSII